MHGRISTLCSLAILAQIGYNDAEKREKRRTHHADLSAAPWQDRIQRPETLSGPAGHPAFGGERREAAAGRFFPGNRLCAPAAAHFPDGEDPLPGNETSAHPDGERKSDFCRRVCTTFAELVDEALENGEEQLGIVAHGGTQMAAMERFAVPHKTFHEWCGPNAGGYVLDACDWKTQRVLHVVKTVQYAEENA